ncbi:MAG: 50S ribosomal protein L4 [Candidatus Pacearchaeota archaeon]|nr:MAG: 50S ribosomal protein L4 [Candidatus Pacearchaeota archaeon]
MKKVSIIGLEGGKVKEIELPAVFNVHVREDIIHKVFESTKKQQLYGSYTLAGIEAAASSKQSHRRHKYKTLYGHGISRVPRKVLTRRGERFYWRGAFIPGTVGGRAAHPPKALKRRIKVNKKEGKIALQGSIAATASKKILEKKYKKLKITFELPVIIESSILEQKAKDIAKFISKLLNIRIRSEKKIRAGKGKMRGRKYKKVRKILLVTSSKEKASKLKNFGLDITQTSQLNVSTLSSGGIPGRIVIWTERAMGELK